MKAVMVREFGPFDQAEYVETPDPEPGPDQVLVAIKAAEVNFPDLMVMEGSYQFRPPLPFSPGKGAAGVIEAVGSDVNWYRPGEKVTVQVEYGAYAEKLAVSASCCYSIPERMPFETAAALGLVYQTSHFAIVDRARLAAGESVLVLGASGGVGFAAVQLAKALGAGVVIAGAVGVENQRIATLAGADCTIDLSMHGLRDGLRDAVWAITGGRGVDVVIDPVGGVVTDAALRAMAWRGRLILIGFASGDVPLLKANYLLVKNISVSGLQWSDYRERDPGWVARVQEEIFDLYGKGLLKPLVSRILPLERYATALSLLRDGKAQGKIILSVGDG